MLVCAAHQTSNDEVSGTTGVDESEHGLDSVNCKYEGPSYAGIIHEKQESNACSQTTRQTNSLLPSR